MSEFLQSQIDFLSSLGRSASKLSVWLPREEKLRTRLPEVHGLAMGQEVIRVGKGKSASFEGILVFVDGLERAAQQSFEQSGKVHHHATH